MQNIKAVIFDLDGIIIDSEPWQKEAFEKTLKPYKIKLSESEFEKLIGIRTYENFIKIVKDYKLNADPFKLTEIKNKYYNQILREKIKPRHGLVDLLKYLTNKKYLICIGSGSIAVDVFNSINLLNIKNYFKVIITGDDVKNGKPEPDIFLKVASQIKVNPVNCVVIEDSENGIIAARRANMVSIAVPTKSTRNHNFMQADYIFSTLQEIKKIL